MPPKRSEPRARSNKIVSKQVPLPPNIIAGLKVTSQLKKRTRSSIEEDDIQHEDIEQDDVEINSEEDNRYPPFHLHGDYSVDEEDDEDDDNNLDSRSHQIRPIGRKIIGRASSSSSSSSVTSSTITSSIQSALTLQSTPMTPMTMSSSTSSNKTSSTTNIAEDISASAIHIPDIVKMEDLQFGESNNFSIILNN